MPFCANCGAEGSKSFCATCGQPLAHGAKGHDVSPVPSSDSGIPVPRPVSKRLVAGIVFAPWIFSWFTLRKGYSGMVRGLSFSWLALLVLGNVQGRTHSPPMSANSATASVTTAGAEVPLHQSNDADNLDCPESQRIRKLDARTGTMANECRREPSEPSRSARGAAPAPSRSAVAAAAALIKQLIERYPDTDTVEGVLTMNDKAVRTCRANGHDVLAAAPLVYVETLTRPPGPPPGMMPNLAEAFATYVLTECAAADGPLKLVE
jgi:hypothetical protein